MSEKTETTNPDVFERVRSVAHQMWEDEGRPEGRAEQHWLAAEAIIKAQIEAAEAEPPAWLQPAASAPEAETPGQSVNGIAEIRQRIQGRSAA